MQKNIIFLFFIATVCLSAWPGNAREIPSGLEYTDQYTLISNKNFLKDFKPVNPDGTINVVVEIPTGTIAKWEVEPDGETIKWQFKKDKPRLIKYLGYPGNYGMIPQTLFPQEAGGDNEPLDAIVLGPSIPRGTIVKAKLIGMLKLLDKGEQDNKLITVIAEAPFDKVDTIQKLKKKFSGVTKILEIWFSNYKGKNKIEIQGFAEEEEAKQILEIAANAFQK